jgi:flagellum-specific peptidoglycan hydrolase FlgJ
MFLNTNALATDMKTRLHQIVDAAELVYGADSIMSKIAVAQAQQESGIVKGASGLARDANNLFGIKGTGTAGSVNVKTHEYVKGKKIYIMADFAKNASITDSFVQHCTLMHKPLYKAVIAAKTFVEAAKALQNAGYATDPNYPKNLLAAYKAVEKRL